MRTPRVPGGFRAALRGIITADAPVARGCSKFGGSPDLPTEFKWPHHKLGPYRFIGQVYLADILKGPHELPGGGLLSFFYAHDEDGNRSGGTPITCGSSGSKTSVCSSRSRRLRLFVSARLRRSSFNWARTCRPGRGMSPLRVSGRSASPCGTRTGNCGCGSIPAGGISWVTPSTQAGIRPDAQPGVAVATYAEFGG